MPSNTVEFLSLLKIIISSGFLSVILGCFGADGRGLEEGVKSGDGRRESFK